MTAAAAAPEASESRSARLLRSARREPALAAFSVLWLLFFANFTGLIFGSGDALEQYHLVQRWFGDTGSATGYYFGLALLEVPFYALGKLFEVVGIHTLGGQPVESALISVAPGLLLLPGIAVLVWILRRLQLPVSLTVLVGAVFGTPLFYYAVFQPGKNHLADALLFTAVIALVYAYLRDAAPSGRLVVGLGALLGFSMTVRYFAGAELVPLLVALLWLRRFRHAAVIAATAAATFGLLALIPKAYGVGIFTGGSYSADVLVFAPLNPLRMLFTDHRGLFVWSPVALIGAIGYVRVVRIRPQDRLFLLVAAAMGLGIVASYALVPFWDGTYSYSQRFFTPLFPLVAIGLAGAFDARPRTVSALAALGVAWSLFLCFNMQTIGGYKFFERRGSSATSLADLPRHDHYSVGAYTWGIYRQSRLVRSWLPWPGTTPTRP